MNQHSKSGLYQSSSLADLERLTVKSDQSLESKTVFVEEPTHHLPDCAPFLSPTRRIRNPHNAVFGQHLPNAWNAPDCARRVFGAQAALLEEHQLCQNIMHPHTSHEKENIPTDTHVDDPLSQINLNQLVDQQAHRERRNRNGVIDDCRVQASESNVSNNKVDKVESLNKRASLVLSTSPSSSTPAFYDLCDLSNEDSPNRLPSTTTAAASARSTTLSNFGGIQEGANYRDSRCRTSPSTSQSMMEQVHTGHMQSAPHSLEAFASSNLFALSSQSQPLRDSSKTRGASESYNPYSRGTQNHVRNTSSRDFDEIQQPTKSCQGDVYHDHQLGFSSDPSHDLGSAYISTYSAASSFGSTNVSTLDTFNPTVPLCTTHNQPCRLLTARSEANAGRQFYKCSVIDQDACDFFQWADGNDNNRIHFLQTEGMNTMYGGQVLDHHAENRRKFGHSSFRPGQKEVIENALQGRDVFVLMPTGGGKSLCYQLPAWCCPGLAVVVSPLLSLIQDQVQSMTKLGVQSVFLNSAQDYETEQRDIQRRLHATTAHGGVKLLYITPEKLRHSGLIKSILTKLYDRNHISRFVVDEAHCLR